MYKIKGGGMIMKLIFTPTSNNVLLMTTIVKVQNLSIIMVSMKKICWGLQ